MDSQEVAVGWWPGDPKYNPAAFYAYAHPAPDGFAETDLAVEGAHWSEELGLFVLNWDDVRESPDPHQRAVEFVYGAFRHACLVCQWDPALAASAEGKPPPVS
jgi:hypothetical protein